ncbi:MAG TPA: cytochrome c [Vicinamibacterales bacterium]|jgi:mono/diheme cytochrome c family protein
MRRLLPIALLMWLVSPGCADVDRDLPPDYRRVEIPTVRLASGEAKVRGRELFAQNCALCHGERGDGHGVRREGLTRPPRDFTSAAWQESTSPRHVFYAIREGLPGTPMPSWKALSEQDAWDMTSYVLSIGDRR